MSNQIPSSKNSQLPIEYPQLTNKLTKGDKPIVVKEPGKTKPSSLLASKETKSPIETIAHLKIKTKNEYETFVQKQNKNKVPNEIKNKIEKEQRDNFKKAKEQED